MAMGAAIMMADSISSLRMSADPSAPFSQQATLARRLRAILPELHNLRPLRIALLGNGTLDHFVEVLVFWLALEGFCAEVHLAPYGAYRQEILDPHSALYTFRPQIVWLFATGRDIGASLVDYGAPPSACKMAVNAVVSEWISLWKKLQANLSVSILQSNLDSPAIRIFGQYDGTVPWSQANLIRRINLALAEAAHENSVSLFDLDHIASMFGLQRWHEDRHWYQSKQPFAPDAFGLVAFQAARLLGSMNGTAKKCIVLDLDDTLWGGVVGDDGLAGIRLGNDAEGEAFVAFQLYLKALLTRGILLAVCSKNEESVAREPFVNHPDMRLRLEDIVVFRANWKSKVDNLREIANSLNIGLESLVFVDNSAVERELVRSVLPEVAVPEMPEDPAEYVAVLAAGHYFETPSFSAEDMARTRLYHENFQREAASSAVTDVSSFLRGLDMEADTGVADALSLPRMAQLLARTNQFHPTTTRHGEAELQELASDPRGWVRWFSLRDRFGEHGIVSVVVLRPQNDSMIIDTWAMSCRVFSRGLEELVFLEMVRAAEGMGARYLIGRYFPTSKNPPVANLFQRLGFSRDGTENPGSRWVLDLSSPLLSFSPFIRWRDSVIQQGKGPHDGCSTGSA